MQTLLELADQVVSAAREDRVRILRDFLDAYVNEISYVKRLEEGSTPKNSREAVEAYATDIAHMLQQVVTGSSMLQGMVVGKSVAFGDVYLITFSERAVEAGAKAGNILEDFSKSISSAAAAANADKEGKP